MMQGGEDRGRRTEGGERMEWKAGDTMNMPQPKDEVAGAGYQLSVVRTGGYFEI
jgi:hypothetical protein